MASLKILARPAARTPMLLTRPYLPAKHVSRSFSAAPALHGQTAIVTGAARGIGKAIALRLARDGFSVCVNDIEANEQGVNETVDSIRSTTSGTAHAHLADVSSPDAVTNLVRDATTTLGPLSVMVANAGINLSKPLLSFTDAEHHHIFAVNYFGVNNCYRAAAEQFIAQGPPPKHPARDQPDIGARPVPSAGVYKIIGCASVASRKPFRMIGPYSASKWAVRGLTHAYAAELADKGITVNSYAPGIVGTKMWEEMDEQIGEYYGVPKGETIRKECESISMGRVSVPEDVAGAVSFLAGRDSDYVTGQMLVVDGGIVFS